MIWSFRDYLSSSSLVVWLFPQTFLPPPMPPPHPHLHLPPPPPRLPESLAVPLTWMPCWARPLSQAPLLLPRHSSPLLPFSSQRPFPWPCVPWPRLPLLSQAWRCVRPRRCWPRQPCTPWASRHWSTLWRGWPRWSAPTRRRPSPLLLRHRSSWRRCRPATPIRTRSQVSGPALDAHAVSGALSLLLSDLCYGLSPSD